MFDILYLINGVKVWDMHKCNAGIVTLPVKEYKYCRLCLISKSVNKFQEDYKYFYSKDGDVYNKFMYFNLIEIINSLSLFLKDLKKEAKSLDYLKDKKYD